MNKIIKKKTIRTIRGTIVGASRVRDIVTKRGKRNQSAMLHIREDAGNGNSAQVAVSVSGELCNYVGCVGARVTVDYVIRVFEIKDKDKKGIKAFGNDVYATSINMIA